MQIVVVIRVLSGMRLVTTSSESAFQMVPFIFIPIRVPGQII